MSILAWLLGRIDHPRFCKDCGRPIDVVNDPDFDPKTGQPRDRWYWRCPETHVTLFTGGGSRASSTGDFVHQWGRGRPGWHRLEHP
jgi:hypothetical protein